MVFLAGPLLMPMAFAQDGAIGDKLQDDLWSAFDVEELEPGQMPLVTLPLTFKVVPDCRLYFNGTRIYDVTVEWTADAGLTLNGRSWKPPEQDLLTGRQETPDSVLIRLYARAPYVARLLADGHPIREAHLLYLDERIRFEALIDSLYYAATSEGLSSRDATRRALEQAAELDRLNLVDYSLSAPNEDGTGVVIKYVGSSTRFGYPLQPKSAHPWSKEQVALMMNPPVHIPDEHEARLEATTLYRSLSGLLGYPCIILIPGWMRVCGEDPVRKACDQIDRVLASASPGAAARDSGMRGEGLDHWQLLRIVYAVQEGR